MIVADANLLAYLLIDGPHTDSARKCYLRDPVWVSPALWRSEFLNILVTTTKAGIQSSKQAQALWRRAVAIIVADYEPEPDDVLNLAVQRKISGYDAHYISVARMLNTVVVTGDKKLVSRCSDLAVLIQDFATIDD